MVVDAAMRPVPSLAQYMRFFANNRQLFLGFTNEKPAGPIRISSLANFLSKQNPSTILHNPSTILHNPSTILAATATPTARLRSKKLPLWLFLSLSRTIPPSSLVK
jgi:hypothetical protein